MHMYPRPAQYLNTCVNISEFRPDGSVNAGQFNMKSKHIKHSNMSENYRCLGNTSRVLTKEKNWITVSHVSDFRSDSIHPVFSCFTWTILYIHHGQYIMDPVNLAIPQYGKNINNVLCAKLVNSFSRARNTSVTICLVESFVLLQLFVFG